MSQPLYSSRFKSNLHILRSGTWAQLYLEIQRIIYLGIFKVPEKAKKAGTEHRTAPSLLSNCELCYCYFVTICLIFSLKTGEPDEVADSLEMLDIYSISAPDFFPSSSTFAKIVQTHTFSQRSLFQINTN